MRKKYLIILTSIGIFILAIILGVLLYYEKSCTKGYKNEILKEEDYKGTIVEEWIKECNVKNGYGEFVYSDPDSWDMFIYYPNINPELHYTKYRIELKYIDYVIKVYLTEEDAFDDGDVIKDLILRIQAPLRGAWPTKSELYLNGKTVKCVCRQQKG